MPKTEFQIRRENGGIEHYASFKEALAVAQQPDVWKLSFGLSTGERVRLVKRVHQGPWGGPQFVLEQMPDLEAIAKGGVP